MMASDEQFNVTTHPSIGAFAARRGSPGPVDPGGGGGDDGNMSDRVSALEARFEAVMPTLATRADIAELRADFKQGIIETHRWMIGTAIGLMVGFGGLFLAMSNALKQSGPSQPAVVILSGQATGTATAAGALSASTPSK